MGEFDCYCLLCSGPLISCDIGSTSRSRLTRRRRRITKKLLAIEEGRSFDSFASEEDSDEDEEQDSDDEDEVGGEVWEPDERRSYDPDVARSELVGWVEDIRVLGEVDGRAFVSGRAKYDDAGLIYVEQGDDPNQPSITEKPYYDCYVPSNENEVVFPFHTHCMTVFEEAFKWSCARSRRGKESLDLTTLYKTATRIGGLVNLNLDYGGISGVDQCWECIPGEEYSVINPLQFSLDALDSIYKPPTQRKEKANANETEETRVVIDPFASLPLEILHLICGGLPGDALQSFLTASTTAYYATKNESFWKALCLERVPWAWEVWRDINGDGQGKLEVNYKRLFFCIEGNTVARFGLGVESRGWLGLVNRRRIWNVCVEVLGAYWEDRKGVDVDGPGLGS